MKTTKSMKTTKNIQKFLEVIEIDEGEFNCHDYKFLHKVVSDLRRGMLFTYDSAGAAYISDVAFLKALDFLQLAASCLEEASYWQMKENK